MVPRWYPPIGRPIGTPPRDTHITWPWRLRPAVSYQSSGAASAPGGNTPRALYGAGADGHPEAPDRRPLGACPYRRQCAECSPSKFIDGLFQTVMGRSMRLRSPYRHCGNTQTRCIPKGLLALQFALAHFTTGEKIRYYRKLRGLYQGELGEKIGVSKGAIRHYETDFRTPKQPQVEAIAEALDISPLACWTSG